MYHEICCFNSILVFYQYEGDDEEVDVEKVDSEMLDIDINSEVDIEQV